MRMSWRRVGAILDAMTMNPLQVTPAKIPVYISTSGSISSELIPSAFDKITKGKRVSHVFILNLFSYPSTCF